MSRSRPLTQSQISSASFRCTRFFQDLLCLQVIPFLPFSGHSLPGSASLSTVDIGGFDMDDERVRQRRSCCKPVIRGGQLSVETRCSVPTGSSLHFSDAYNPGTFYFLLQSVMMTDVCLSPEDSAIKSQGN